MAESTTATGRMIVKHQCRVVATQFGDSYDIDFPLYQTVKEATDAGHLPNVALHGPVFNGKFQSDSVIYGDTDSTYFKTYTLTTKDAIIKADNIAAEVNKSYPKFMRDMFLCTEGYDLIIKAGREIVSDRGIFVDKKRYILHLIDLDGKTVDKMKVMGLDTKKSTLPRAVASKLNGFVEDLLRGQEWDDVAKRIVAYKTELRDSIDILDLGLPKGVKNIERYTNEYRMHGEGSRLPGHVAASIHYNECLAKYNDRTSPKITSGMKIKVFYLMGKHGKFKSIAIPTDIEMPPIWFEQYYTVDKVAHITRLIDNPLSNILKAIGKSTPSIRSLKIESALVF